MTSYQLIEDTSGNIELHEDSIYKNCFSSVEAACDSINPSLDEGDEIKVIYRHCSPDNYLIDDLLMWREY